MTLFEFLARATEAWIVATYFLVIAYKRGVIGSLLRQQLCSYGLHFLLQRECLCVFELHLLAGALFLTLSLKRLNLLRGPDLDMAQETHHFMLQSARRTLQAVAAASGYGACDALCQTQVQWLQGIFAAAILVVAALSGMSCLYLLDTPTRFQAPKDAARAE